MGFSAVLPGAKALKSAVERALEHFNETHCTRRHVSITRGKLGKGTVILITFIKSQKIVENGKYSAEKEVHVFHRVPSKSNFGRNL